MINGAGDLVAWREQTRIGKAWDRLFEGEEAVLHLRGICGGAPRCAVTMGGNSLLRANAPG
jgi:hypothetical protein